MRRALLTLLPLAAAAAAGTSYAQGPGPRISSATGQGESAAHTFSFSAQTGKTGQVAGQARFQTVARPRKIYKIQVTCLRVFGNMATVGGSLVGVSPTARYKGADFQLLDGDILGDPGRDRISGIVRLRAVPRTCSAPNPSRMRYVVQGQITVSEIGRQ